MRTRMLGLTGALAALFGPVKFLSAFANPLPLPLAIGVLADEHHA